jgi:hypothetical protein
VLEEDRLHLFDGSTFAAAQDEPLGAVSILKGRQAVGDITRPDICQRPGCPQDLRPQASTGLAVPASQAVCVYGLLCTALATAANEGTGSGVASFQGRPASEPVPC